MNRRIRLKRDDNINCEDRQRNGGLDVASERLQSARIDLSDIHPENRLAICGSDRTHIKDSTLTARKLAGKKTIIRYEICKYVVTAAIR